MRNRAMPLTDAALHRALLELAGEPDGAAVLADVMRTVDATPQLRRRPWNLPPVGRGTLLLAAVVAILGIGAAVTLSQPQPGPRPAPSTQARDPDALTVAEFVMPFRYEIPQGETEAMTQPGGRPLYGLLHGSGNLTMFEVTGSIHTCELEDVPEPSAEPARVTGHVGTDPARFIEGLRDRVGIAIGEIRSSMLGNLPAMEAEIGPSDRSECYPQAHLDRMGIGGLTYEPELRGPGKLIVAQAGAHTIGVLINAADGASYEDWLPTAQAYVDSFDFYTADD